MPDSFDSADRLKRMQGAVEQVIKSAGIKPPVSPAPAFAARSPAQPSPHTTVSTRLSQHRLVSTTPPTPPPPVPPFTYIHRHAHTQTRTQTHTHTHTHATVSTSLHCSPSKYCLFFVSANPPCILSHVHARTHARTHTHRHTHTHTHLHTHTHTHYRYQPHSPL